MTVCELIDILKGQDPTAKVFGLHEGGPAPYEPAHVWCSPAQLILIDGHTNPPDGDWRELA